MFNFLKYNFIKNHNTSNYLKLYLQLLFVLTINTSLLAININSEITGANNADCNVRMIWSGAPHNAFTDIIRYNNQFFCAFREGSA
ncbi:MAG: hypothetical protein WC341_06115, partial [Bacteroidales bacterium]